MTLKSVKPTDAVRNPIKIGSVRSMTLHSPFSASPCAAREVFRHLHELAALRTAKQHFAVHGGQYLWCANAVATPTPICVSSRHFSSAFVQLFVARLLDAQRKRTVFIRTARKQGGERVHHLGDRQKPRGFAREVARFHSVSELFPTFIGAYTKRQNKQNDAQKPRKHQADAPDERRREHIGIGR